MGTGSFLPLPQRHDVHEKGIGAHRDNAVLSCSITDPTLAAEGININLWGRGVKDNFDHVANNPTPGDLNLKLICGSRSSNEGDGDAVHPSENAVEGGGGNTNSRRTAMEVRLFSNGVEEEAGVGMLNLGFRSDKGQHPIVMPENARQREGLEKQPTPKNEPQTPTTTPAPDLTDIYRSSIWLVEETAKHIRAIEEVRC